jgi:hypothetical protein
MRPRLLSRQPRLCGVESAQVPVQAAPSQPQQQPQHDVALPDATSQVLAARRQLQRAQGADKTKRVNRQPQPARGR